MYRGNYRARGGRGGRGRRPGESDERRSSGVFKDGYWHCDCVPPITASYFQVKKDTPNKGRWFYTCAKDRDNGEARCGFFLWADQAKVREEAAVLNNSRNEPESTHYQAPTSSDRPRSPRPAGDKSPPPPYTPVGPDSGTRGKRKAHSLDDEGEDLPRRFPGDEGERFHYSHETTPRKASRTYEYSTPSRRKLPWLDDSRGERDLRTPSTSRFREDRGGNDPHQAYPTPMTERTATVTDSLYGRTREPRRTPSPSPLRSSAHIETEVPSIYTEVFDFIQSRRINLESDESEKLGSLLKKNDMRAEGLLRGRNISRLSIKAKDAKISELEHRLASLEAELETQKAISAHLKWEKEIDDEL